MNYSKRMLISIPFFIATAFILFNSCTKDDNLTDPLGNRVYTTLDRTIVPSKVVSWPVMFPFEVSKFPDYFGYGDWSYGPGLEYQKRLDLMTPGYTGGLVKKSARLLNFFAITDAHMTDEETPASAMYFGYKGGFIGKKV
jgi:hypothetical protein